jgi:hypothetical protein
MREAATYLAGRLRLAVLCVFVSAATLAGVWGAGAFTLSRDVGPLRHAIAFAFQTGALPDHLVAVPDRRTGAFTYNDCVILIMAVNTSQPLVKKVLSPALIAKLSDPGETDACLMLRDLVVEGRESDYTNWPYHRYIHAFVPVTAMAVATLGLDGWRTVLLVVNYAGVAALGAIGAACWSRRRREGLPARASAIAAMIASVAFALFFGMDFYSQNLSIGLAEPIVFAWAGILAFGQPLVWRESTLVLLTGFTFALITAFEFWTGQIPVAAAIGVAFMGLSIRDRRQTWFAAQRALVMLCAAGLTIACMLAFKIVVASIVFGQNIAWDLTGQIETRLGDASYGVFGLVQRLAGRADHIGQGSLALGLGAGLAAVAAGLAGALRLASGPPLARSQAAFVGISALMIVAWHLVFRNHSSIHSEFMVRTFAWVWCAGLILLALSLRRSSLHDDDVPNDLATVEQVEGRIDLLERPRA